MLNEKKTKYKKKHIKKKNRGISLEPQNKENIHNEEKKAEFWEENKE